MITREISPNAALRVCDAIRRRLAHTLPIGGTSATESLKARCPMKITVTSPFENLAAFAIAFGAGIVSTALVSTYVAWATRDAR